MNSRFACLLPVGLVAITTLAMAQRWGPRAWSQQEAGQNGWLFSLDAGKALARKTGMPLMVVIRCQP